MLHKTYAVQAATEDAACHAEHGGPVDSHPCGHLCVEVTHAQAPRSHPQSILSTQVHLTCGHISHAVPSRLWGLISWRVLTPVLTRRSWLGVLTLSLAVVQLLIGVGTYVWPKLSASRRAAAYPYHAFLGAVTFSMALATMLTGIQEKTSFVQVTQHRATLGCS